MNLRLPVLLACSLATGPAAAQLVNGNFETGTLAGWSVGGTGAAAAVRTSHFTGGTPPTVEGTWFALLSNGPENRGGGAQRYDGNTTDDFDFVSLTQTVTVPFAPAVLAFDWNYPSSEQQQPDDFDDLFDLRIGINGGALVQAWSGSSCKSNGTNYSNFPSAPCTGLGLVNWSLNASSPAAVRNTLLRHGVGGWRHACVPIGGLTAGATVTLRFAALDQGDTGYDSALMLDQVEIRSSCDATPTESLRQLTDTSGSAVELKGGGFELRPVDSFPIATNASGTQLAFASSANLTGDNPSAIRQVYAWNGSAYARATGLTLASGGSVQNLAMVANAAGRYVAIAARLNASAPQHVYRWDRTGGVVETVTPASIPAGCVNENPVIGENGTRIVWESTCASLTGAGSARKIVVSTRGATSWPAPAVLELLGTGACEARNPRIDGNTGAGQFVVLESNCNPRGGSNNSDASWEVFRKDLATTGTAGWRQVTATAATRTCTGGSGSESVFNFSPDVGGTAGRYTLFISNADLAGTNAACDSWQVFVNDASGGTSQLTPAATTPRYLAVSLHPDGNNYAFERLGTSFLSEIGRRQRATPATDVTVFQGVLGATGARIGLDGSVPVIHFYGADDPLVDNADGNIEIFSTRGP
ncbi:MAG: hypothetical protein EOP90_04950 [Lysobacteraceae bacterium]|nr:MAG: hypothetical protein EOP90_04950 [Xanthomonadaceae bacterium]